MERGGLGGGTPMAMAAEVVIGPSGNVVPPPVASSSAVVPTVSVAQPQTEPSTGSEKREETAAGSSVPMEVEDGSKTDKLIEYYCKVVQELDSENTNNTSQTFTVIQDLNAHFEMHSIRQGFETVWETAMPHFLRFLNTSTVNLIQEHNNSVLRKLVLEIISRYPFAITRNFLSSLFTTLYSIMEDDNEENALIALRMIADIHKKLIQSSCRMLDEVKRLFSVVRKFTTVFIENTPRFSELSCHLANQFDITPIVNNIFIKKQIQETGKFKLLNLLPCGINSLKVMHDIPTQLSWFLTYYRQGLEAESQEMFNLAIKILSLQLTPEQKEQKSLFPEFVAVQARFLYLIAFSTKFTEASSGELVEKLPIILLNLLRDCPNEVPSVRKDLFQSLRTLMQSKSREKFIDYLDQYFDERLIIGSGYTCQEILRQMAYLMIYDMAHHLREDISNELLRCVMNNYSKKIYDLNATNTYNVMTARLIFNLSDSIVKNAEKERNQILSYSQFMFKFFKTVVDKLWDYACSIKMKREILQHGNTWEPICDDFTDSLTAGVLYNTFTSDDFQLHWGIPELHLLGNNAGDCRTACKTLFTVLKSFTSRISDCSNRYDLILYTTANGNQQSNIAPVAFVRSGYCRVKDLPVLVKLFRAGIIVLEIFNCSTFPALLPMTSLFQKGPLTLPSMSSLPMSAKDNPKYKEEKEQIEIFAYIFMNLPPQIFRAVLKETIGDLVDAVYKNPSLLSLVNTFLMQRTTTAILGNVLAGYLVENMEIIGNEDERSNLYIKLFKQVFNSVPLSAENERMLQPHIRKLVDKAITLAASAKEPSNYFVLLRALFRSIGGGTHDQLYQEFLPMLPSLLQSLNLFHAGQHRQNMKDLFVELCLTIPVRLSSLLPYLPYLMDPLVSGLHGTQHLMAQALRTLELCIDNLQPDFFYEHIQPIRTDLLHALYKTSRAKSDTISQTSLRVLGKLGGVSHTMMVGPQTMEYIQYRDPLVKDFIANDEAMNAAEKPAFDSKNVPKQGVSSYMTIRFPETDGPLHFPVDKIIETSYRVLRQANVDKYYWKHCWEVVKGFLIAHVQIPCSEEEMTQMAKLLHHPSFSNGIEEFPTKPVKCCGVPVLYLNRLYKFPDEKIRQVHVKAIAAMMLASAIKEVNFRSEVWAIMVPIVRYYTLVAICQQTGPIQSTGSRVSLRGMDPLVLVDALHFLMSNEDLVLSKACLLVLRLIFDTVISVLGSNEKACQLPLYVYVLDRVIALCYGRPWYSKYGGCFVIQYLFQRMSRRWLLIHSYVILKAMIFVIVDLDGDLSSGLVEMAKENMKNVVLICIDSVPAEQHDLAVLQAEAYEIVAHELTRQITASSKTVRTEAGVLLEEIARVKGISLSAVIEPHKEAIIDMIPPKKTRLNHNPVAVQIGLLEGITFCNNLEPRIFEIDPVECRVFIEDVKQICSGDLKTLLAHGGTCYKTVANLNAIRKAAYRTFASLHFLTEQRETIFSQLYGALNTPIPDLMECGYQCFAKYPDLKEQKIDIVRQMVRSCIVNITDIKAMLRDGGAQRLIYLSQLFPQIFNDKFCEQMLAHLNRVAEYAQQHIKKYRELDLKIRYNPQEFQQQQQQQAQPLQKTSFGELEQTMSALLNLGSSIIEVFCNTSSAEANYVESLLDVLNKTETMMEIYGCGKTYYEPMRKFLTRYPQETVQVLQNKFNEINLFWFFNFLLQGPEGKPFRNVIFENPAHFIQILKSSLVKSTELSHSTLTLVAQQALPVGAMVDVKAEPAQSSAAPGHTSLSSANLNLYYSRYQVIRLIWVLTKHNKSWLKNQPELVDLLKRIWISETFQKEQVKGIDLEYCQWSESKLLTKCLVAYLEQYLEDYDFWFQLLRVFTRDNFCSFRFFAIYLKETMTKTFSVEWKRAMFERFNFIFPEEYTEYLGYGMTRYTLEWPQELKAKVLQYIIIPCFKYEFESGRTEEILGASPRQKSSSAVEEAEEEEEFNDLIDMFVHNLLLKEKRKNNLSVVDSVRIHVLQFACLVMEHASHYILPIQVSENERVPRSKRSTRDACRLRSIIHHLYPLIFESALGPLDPAKKAYNILMMSFLISKFSIHRKITRDVFTLMLTSQAGEAKAIIRKAFDVMIPNLPSRKPQAYEFLRFQTKRSLVQDGNIINQQMHLMQLIVKYYRLFYVSRHLFYHQMVSIAQRLGLIMQGQNSEQRKLSLDIIEVIIRWEHIRIAQQEQQIKKTQSSSAVGSEEYATVSRQDESDSEMVVGPTDGDPQDDDKKNKSSFHQISLDSEEFQKQQNDPMPKELAHSVVAFLARFLIYSHDIQILPTSQQLINVSNTGSTMPHDHLTRRAIVMLKEMLKCKIWEFTNFRLQYFETILPFVKDIGTEAANRQTPSYYTICLALDVLVIFMQTLPSKIVLQILHPMQKALAAVCACTNKHVVQTLHQMLTHLMTLFPPPIGDSSSPAPSMQLQPLEQLYTDLHSLILNGFVNYNKLQQGPLQLGAGFLVRIQNYYAIMANLYAVLMCLKAACLNQPIYVDRLATPFNLMLIKLVKEHVFAIAVTVTDNRTISQREAQLLQEYKQLLADNIIISLGLIKDRVRALNAEARRGLLHNVFFLLLDKTPEARVMRAMLKIVDEWIRQPLSSTSGSGRASSATVPQSFTPVLREKTQLLIRMSQNIEKRFGDDKELVAQFLELIYFIYSDDSLRCSDISSKLEFAFMWGLKCDQPAIRTKFFALMDNTLRKRIYERILYIICAQNWESIGAHYWIKQCIELILAISSPTDNLATPFPHTTLPLPTALVPLQDQQEKSSVFTGFTSILSDHSISCTPTDQLMELDFIKGSSSAAINTTSTSGGIKVNLTTTADVEMEDLSSVGLPTESKKKQNKQNLLGIICEFFQQVKDVKSNNFYNSVAQLCHFDDDLAQHVWLQLFPRIFGTMNERQQMVLRLELPTFLISGAHIPQTDARISSIATFFEAISFMDPPIKMDISFVRYLSKCHSNMWHRSALILENEMDSPGSGQPALRIGAFIYNESGKTIPFQPVVGTKNTRGVTVVNGENQQIQMNINELVPTELPMENLPTYGQECSGALAYIYEIFKEEDYWAGIWQKRANYKETLMAIAYEQQGYFDKAKGAYELAMNKGSADYNINPYPFKLVDEVALWERHWIRCSQELNQWDFILEYGLKSTVPNPILVLESSWRIPNWKLFEEAKEKVEQNYPREYQWKMAMYRGYHAVVYKRDFGVFDRCVDHAMAFLVKDWTKLPLLVGNAHIEVLHAAHRVIELHEAGNFQNTLFLPPDNTNRIELRSVLKTWKNRLPLPCDDLSFWSNIFTWRQHHYQSIVTKYEEEIKAGVNVPNQLQYASAQVMSGSHHSATSLITLAKVARKQGLVNVALELLNRIHTIPKVPVLDCAHKIMQQLKCYLWQYQVQSRGEELSDAMSVITGSQLTLLTVDQAGEIAAVKGHIFRLMGQVDEAEKTFSVAIQLNENSHKSWALWAEFHDDRFVKSAENDYNSRNFRYGSDAIIAYINACRQHVEPKCRKYLARVLWLLTYDKDNNPEGGPLLASFERYSSLVHSLCWLPWLPQLITYFGQSDGQKLCQFMVRISQVYPQAIYYPLRVICIQSRIEARELKSRCNQLINLCSSPRPVPELDRAPASMQRVTRLINMQREHHPHIVGTIEVIVEQLTSQRRDLYEDATKLVKNALSRCYQDAFEQRNNLEQATVTTSIVSYLRKLSTLIDPEGQNKGLQGRPGRNSVRDPEIWKLRPQFTADFDLTIPESRNLENFITKMRKWQKLLENRSRANFMQPFFLEDRCRALSNFSNKSIELALFGEFLAPKANHYNIVNIAKFLPQVQPVEKHGTYAVRLFIRGHNGKVYAYLLIADSMQGEARREERFLQLQRLLNHTLTKHKETARRMLSFTVQKVVPIGPTVRLVEDNVSSISLYDIFRHYAARHGFEGDDPLVRYYARHRAFQSKTNPQSIPPSSQDTFYRDIYNEIQAQMCPRTVLKEWVMISYATASEYWHFRKMFTTQLALAQLSEYVFCTHKLTPEMLCIHRDTGLIDIAYYRFEVKEETGELTSNLKPPFRLTPNIQTFITDIGIKGPLTAAIIATANCFYNHNNKVRSILYALYRDELYQWNRRIMSQDRFKKFTQLAGTIQRNNANAAAGSSDSSGAISTLTPKQLTQLVISTILQLIDHSEPNRQYMVAVGDKSIQAILTRLSSLSSFEGPESNATNLIQKATDPNILVLMDPAWYPWL